MGRFSCGGVPGPERTTTTIDRIIRGIGGAAEGGGASNKTEAASSKGWVVEVVGGVALTVVLLGASLVVGLSKARGVWSDRAVEAVVFGSWPVVRLHRCWGGEPNKCFQQATFLN